MPVDSPEDIEHQQDSVEKPSFVLWALLIVLVAAGAGYFIYHEGMPGLQQDDYIAPP